MVTISPPQKSFELHAWFLVASVATVLCLLPLNHVERHRVWIGRFVIFPTASFLLLSYRYVTPEHAVALRLMLTGSEYSAFLRGRYIIPSKHVYAFWINLFLVFILANWPLPIETTWDKTMSAMFWLFLRLCALQALVYCVLIAVEGFLQGRHVKDEEKKLQEIDVGVNWTCVACDSLRGEQTWLRRVVAGEKAGLDGKLGDEGRQVWELEIVLTPEHRKYKPEDQDKPVGQVLRIEL